MASPNTGTITQYVNLVYQLATATNEHDPVFASAEQTLPGITQAGVASSLGHMLVDTAIASETISNSLNEEIHDIVIGTDRIVLVRHEELADIANATDELVGTHIIPLTDVVLASDNIETQQTTSLSSVAKATDELSFSSSLMLTSIVQASDSFTISRFFTLSDTANASDNLDGQGIFYAELSSTAYASEVFAFGQEEILVANVVARDELTSWNSVSEMLVSAAEASDSFGTWKVSFEMLSDTANASESFAFDGSVYNETIHDTAQASDWIWGKDFGSIAWVLNTQSGGLSNYDNYGFTSMAFHNGKLYATSPEGIFELDADDDTGRDIDSTLGYGFLDFGTEHRKRISDIYLGCTGNDIECDVETFNKLTYTYDMEYRELSSPYNNRIKPGRGLSSRWWRFTFRNIGGADFQIHDIAVEIAKSKRRL
jgi:hypothetical protein